MLYGELLVGPLTPVERVRVDEVRRSEGSKPCAEEADGSGKTKSVRAEALRRQLAAGHPGIGRDATIVTHDIQNRDSNDNLAKVSLACRRGVCGKHTFPVDDVPGFAL